MLWRNDVACKTFGLYCASVQCAIQPHTYLSISYSGSSLGFVLHACPGLVFRARFRIVYYTNEVLWHLFVCPSMLGVCILPMSAHWVGTYAFGFITIMVYTLFYVVLCILWGVFSYFSSLTFHLTPLPFHLTTHTSHLAPHTSHLRPHISAHTSHLSPLNSYLSRRTAVPLLTWALLVGIMHSLYL